MTFAARRSPRRLPALAFILVVLAVVTADATPSSAGPGLSWINSVRANRGLNALAGSGGLDNLAASHTRQMINQNRLFHTGNLGGAVSSVYPNWTHVGENVGVGTSLSSVQSAFLNSAEHRANIYGAYNVAGTAAITGPDGRVWVTQIFAQVPGLGGATATAAPRTSTSTRTAAPRVSRSAPRTSEAAAAPERAPQPDAPAVDPEDRKGVAGVATASPHGYWLSGRDGRVFAFGQARNFGDLGGQALAAPVISMVPSPTGLGYWLVGRDGGVFSFGDAAFRGGVASAALNAPVVGMASQRSGLGYWLASADGGVFSFGAAAFQGGLAGQPLAAPITAIAATPTGLGYWLVAQDGGVFAFGDASFYGGLAGRPLAAPIVSITATPSGWGYWLLGADGGVFSFGDAAFYGSPGATPLNGAAVALSPTPDGNGYWVAARDAGVFAFGAATFEGALAGQPLDVR